MDSQTFKGLVATTMIQYSIWLQGRLSKCAFQELVRPEGLEPSRPKTPEPKSGASANSATSAYARYCVLQSGPCGNRTRDLLLAKQVLYQLS